VYLEIAHCRTRQRRLLEVMQRERLDLVIVNQPAHVQWLVGRRFSTLFESAVALSADGRCTLASPLENLDNVAADEIVAFPSNRYSTLRNDQQQAAEEALLQALAGRPQPRRLGIEFSSAPAHVTTRLSAQLVDVEPELYRLRRRKEADEVALLRKAIDTSGAMYARAREIIKPGIKEFDVFCELHTVAVKSTGETTTGVGNDFQCGTSGGPPRERAAEDGELYIIDLSPSCQGYYADTCRTIAVNKRPTDDQHKAWEKIERVQRYVERTVKPGVRCREIFDAAQALLDEYRLGAFAHHLGHGIGLFPHEAPHLNPNWDDVFEEGEVFTAEPGLYGPELRGGIRIENDFLVTAAGVELLSRFSEAL